MAVLEAVTTMVWPAWVMTDGDCPADDDPLFDVVEGLAELLEELSVSTSATIPDKYTVYVPSPPQSS